MNAFETRVLKSLNKGLGWGQRQVHTLYGKDIADYIGTYNLSKETSGLIAKVAFEKLYKQKEEWIKFESLQQIKVFLMKEAQSRCIKHRNYLAREIKNMPWPVGGNTIGLCYRLVENLPKGCRSAYKLRYLECLSIPEIARKLKITQQEAIDRSAQGIVLIKQYQRTGNVLISKG